ncbi:MAG: hypothetical protein K1X61_13400 [Chitinophagales bacterium]|nr:hypothetical protein [Chitinophagales bacterium]
MSDEKKFIKGFNHGYILTKYLPSLVSNLIGSLKSTNEYFSGFFAGKQEYEMEKAKNELEVLGQIRDRAEDRERNVEKDL